MSERVLTAAAAPRAGSESAAAERGGWRPWTIASVAPAPGAAPARAARPDRAPAQEVRVPPRPDPAELECLRQQAREAAAAQGRSEGWAQGHDEGYRAGLQQAQAEGHAQAAQLRAIIQELPGALASVDAQLADTLAALALEIARQVIGRQIDMEPGAIVPLVHSLVVQEPAFSGNPRLLLHPLDAELVRGTLGPELEAAGWQVRPDEAVGRGGCQVLAASGACDATVETRTRRVAAALSLALDAP